MSTNLEFEKILYSINLFEKKFKSNSQDSSLVTDLKQMFDTIKGKKFNPDELKEIQSRAISLGQLFEDKKQQLKEQSSKLLKTQKQLKSYVKNSHIRNNK